MVTTAGNALIEDAREVEAVAISDDPQVVAALKQSGYAKCVVSQVYDIYFVPPNNPGEAVALREFKRRVRQFGAGEDHAITESVLRTWQERAGGAGAKTRQEARDDANALVEELLNSAVSSGASDVHVNVRGETEVLFRIHGILSTRQHLSSQIGTQLITVLFQSYARVPYGAEEARDGQFYFSAANGRSYLARLNKLRMAGGGVTCKMRLRDTAEVIDLSKAGYSPAQLKILKEMMGRGQGLLVVTGGVNSGKSTTMTALLASIPPQYSVLELSDTVEVRLPNVCHVELPADGEDLEKRIAAVQDSTVRQDSDYLAIGEMRNRATASKAEIMGLQGRFVLSTGHAYSPIAFFNRMISAADFGMSELTVLSPRFMVGLISQALVETLCQRCAQPRPSPQAMARSRYRDEAALLRHLGDGLGALAERVRYLNPEGCDSCHRTGLTGRTVVAEMLPFDEDLCALLRAHDYDAVRGHAAARDLHTKHEHGLGKVLRGEMDPLMLGRRIDALDDSNVRDWGKPAMLEELARC